MNELVEIVQSHGQQGITTASIEGIFDTRYGASKKTVREYLVSAHENQHRIVWVGARWYAPENVPRKTLSDYIVESRVVRLAESEPAV